MKKQIVFVLTELYGNDSDTEVNVLGVYTTKTKAKEMLAEKKQKVLESYEQAFCVSMRFPRTTRHSLRLHTRMSIFGSSY